MRVYSTGVFFREYTTTSSKLSQSKGFLEKAGFKFLRIKKDNVQTIFKVELIFFAGDYQ